MPSHITIVPASTQAGKATIRRLLESAENPMIRGIYRDPSKAPSEFTQSPNFEAVQGDVSTGQGLDFGGSNAVFYVPPPTFDGSDQGEFATRAATYVKNAIQAAPTVKKLLLHSAVGAKYSHSIGILRINHITDNLLESAASEVEIIRPGYFFEFWAEAIKTMKAADPEFESPFAPPDHCIPMISIKDVGSYSAKALLSQEARPGLSCKYLFGPRLYSPLDVSKVIQDITGRKGRLITIEREKLPEYFARHVPEMYAQEYTDMITALAPGGIMSGDFDYDSQTARGLVTLEDGLREIAQQ